MKVECIKDKLKDAVSTAEKITGKNLTLPVLSSILLIAKNNILKIRATNLDIGIEVEIPAKIEKEGIVAIPGNILNNLLSTVYSNSISLELDGTNLLLSTKNTSTLIKSFPHDDFPTLPSISKGQSFVISSKNIISGLRSVWFSASTSDIKPEIASVNIHTDSGDMVFIATDSFRLAEKKVTYSGKTEISSILIPFKNVSEIIRVFDDELQDIKIKLNNNQISFQTDTMYLTSRIVDGVFPDYKQILPKEFKTEVILLKQDFINALKLTNLFSDKFNQINIKINPREKTLELNSKNIDVGENIVKLDAALSGEAIKLNFNHKYIIDCFQSIPKDSISLQLNGDGKPLVIRGVGDRSFTYLVMPLNQ